MSQSRVGFAERIRGAVSAATLFAMVVGICAPALAAETATFTGTVLSPDNSAAQGFTVVFKDTATGQEFRSDPTSASGEYRLSVPTGATYSLDSVLASDGTKLEVQNVPPIPVRAAGATRLDVKFSSAMAPGAAAVDWTGAPVAGAVATTPAGTDEKKKDKSGAPWWKRPGPITGMVLGSVAILAIALSGGGGSNPPVASPSTP